MPAVPHAATNGHAPQTQPRNPNVPAAMDTQAHAVSSVPSHQPSPGVLDTSSHSSLHALPRRFLGPLPPEVIQSPEVQAKQSRLHRVRLEALHKINGVLENNDPRRKGSVGGAFEGVNEEGRIRGRLRKIKVLRRGRFGEQVEEEFEFDPTEIEGEDGHRSEHHGRVFHRKKNLNIVMGKGKEHWEGESFNIGREFTTSFRILKKQSNGDQNELPLVEEPVDTMDLDSSSAGPIRKAKRAVITPQSTQDSFVTARTAFTQSPTSTTSRLQIPTEWRNNGPAGSTKSAYSVDERTRTRHSQASSSRPLLGEGADDSVGPSSQSRNRPETTGEGTSSKRLKRLKSAIRKPGPNSTLTMPPLSKNGLNGRMGMRSKSVTFPVDPASVMGQDEPPQAGDRPPEDPEAVLAREGSEAEGTSAGAQESALEEEDWEEEASGRTVNGVLMRGQSSMPRLKSY